MTVVPVILRIVAPDAILVPETDIPGIILSADATVMVLLPLVPVHAVENCWKIGEFKPKVKSNLEKGLVLDLPLTSKYLKDSITITDRTPYEHDGTNNGGDISDEGIFFTRADSEYVSVGNSSDEYFTDAFSFALWIQTESTDQIQIAKKFTANTNGFNMITLSGQQRTWISRDGGQNQYNAGPPINDGKWHLIGMFADADERGVFFDNQKYTTTGIVPIPNTSEALQISGSPYGYVDGSMYGFKFWNRVLTDDEIKLLYARGRAVNSIKISSLQKGLIAHYPLNRSRYNYITKEVTDLTPYSHNATNISDSSLGIDRMGHADGAFVFNGETNNMLSTASSDYFNLANKDFSFGGWFNSDPSNAYTAWGGIILGNVYQLGLSLTMSRFITLDVSSNIISLSYPLQTGNWTHIFITHDVANKTFKAYQNGNYYNDKVYTLPLNQTNSTFNMGNNGAGATTRSFMGSMQDIRVYNRTLSDAEVKQLANSYNSKIKIYGAS